MGAKTARDIAETVTEGESLEAALTYHFTVNHYPPLPLSILPAAIKIVKGEVSLDDEIELPQGVSYRGKTTAPAYECAKAWHLFDFLPGDDDD